MQGIVGKTIVHYPSTHLANHRHVIVNTRDDEVRQFNPYACFPHSQDGVENWLQMTTTDLLIDIITKRLQVDVGSIEIWQQVCQWLLTHIACCHEDVPKAVFMSQPSCIHNILQIRQRFRVGVGDTRAMVASQDSVADTSRRCRQEQRLRLLRAPPTVPPEA